MKPKIIKSFIPTAEPWIALFPAAGTYIAGRYRTWSEAINAVCMWWAKA
jgi:hypothetical protein